MPLIALIFTICAIFTLYMYSSIETAPMYNRTNIRGDIAFQRFGDTGIISECSLGVNLVHDNFFAPIHMKS